MSSPLVDCHLVDKPKIRTDEKICRICHETYNECLSLSNSTKENSLISPCLCSGSIKYVHRDCLNSWRHIHPTFHDNFNRCPTCFTTYKVLENNHSRTRLSIRTKKTLFKCGVFIAMVSMFIACGFIGKSVFISLVRSQLNQFQDLITEEHVKQMVFGGDSLSQKPCQRPTTTTNKREDLQPLPAGNHINRRRKRRRIESSTIKDDAFFTLFSKTNIFTQKFTTTSKVPKYYHLISDPPSVQIRTQDDMIRLDNLRQEKRLQNERSMKRKVHQQQQKQVISNTPKRIETTAELVYACNMKRSNLIVEIFSSECDDGCCDDEKERVINELKKSDAVKVYQRVVSDNGVVFTMNPSSNDLMINEVQYRQCLSIWNNNVYHLEVWLDLWEQNYYRLNVSHAIMALLTLSFIGIFHMIVFWRAYFDLYLLNIVTNRFGVNDRQVVFFGLYHVETYLFAVFVAIGLIKFVVLLRSVIKFVRSRLNLDMSDINDDVVLSIGTPLHQDVDGSIQFDLMTIGGSGSHA